LGVPLLALYGLEDVLVSPQRAHELAAAPRATCAASAPFSWPS